MVYRIYVEKKPALAQEAAGLLRDAREFLGITGLERVRLINRYDVEGIDKALFDVCRGTVFSEPQLDDLPETLPTDADALFAVEYLPGQFDQRADSAAQCIQLLSQGERPLVRTARVYALYGKLSAEDLSRIRRYVINPVEAREASLEPFDTLKVQYPAPQPVAVLEGFCQKDAAGLEEMISQMGLAMDRDDLAFCQAYFREEGREPTLTELRVLDTYWSDHCRHTTFNTIIDRVTFQDKLLEETWADYLAQREALGRKKPVTLMDIGTIAAKALRAQGKLRSLDESEEINACTVKIQADVNGERQDWLLLFKNETHNHPTEIEPFGGAATCVGGAIRDPLSGRSYVYGAMRLTGGADPLRPVSETLPGKLPQRKLAVGAASGYSSYGNQIGLATGLVDELYHPGYAAKRMEIGAVIGAAPAENVRREVPAPGDVVILLGGRTGRDGCGGATGSSKSHDVHSLETCGAEVQKGNAPEERKLQRLFRSPEASRMIKRCNDFGAGGVSVAIGELAPGLDIDLDRVPKKYEVLDGTELAISESQERMAVVVAESDAGRFLALAGEENLEATVVARVTESPRLVMHWQGETIVDLSRAFLDSNGAEKHITVEVPKAHPLAETGEGGFADRYRAACGDLNQCSRRGLSERFDSTIGAGSVLMPFGGKLQQSPIQAMVHKLPVLGGETETCSFMSWGYDPFVSQESPYHGAYLAVVQSIAKLAAAGAPLDEVWLSFQEFFAKPGKDPKRWGAPMAALLGAYAAQKDLGAAAIGGKDSMSGTFEKLDVPPTLVSFAVACGKVGDVRSPELKGAGHTLTLLAPQYGENGLPEKESLRAVFARVRELLSSGKALSAYALGMGGAAEAVFKMAIGNGIGVKFEENLSLDALFARNYGGFVLELAENTENAGTVLGVTTAEPVLARGGEAVTLNDLQGIYENKLEPVYPCNIPAAEGDYPAFSYRAESHAAPAVRVARPQVLIPVFPGTNCEYDALRAVEEAGARGRILVLNNRTSADVARAAETFARAVSESQMIFIPGGFSGGDEPEGSAKLITAFFRNPQVKEQTMALLEQRDGLICGICNGFQALIKLGLVPFGKITETDEKSPTLTYNVIGRHQSRLVRTRIASNKSPWLANTQVGDIFTVPISHGEGRFLCNEELVRKLADNGQIVTQYVDEHGVPGMDVDVNPNGSIWAVEGIMSPDGRVLGKMGHSERVADGLYKNVDGCYDMKLFQSAKKYFDI